MLDPELADDELVINARTLRQFALAWLIFFSGVASWQIYRGHDNRALVFGGLAIVVGALGLIRPSAIKPLFGLLSMLTRPIGVVMTRIILGIMFYVLFTPLALLFRLVGRDALSRKRRPGSTTYWITRPSTTDPRRYFRQ